MSYRQLTQEERFQIAAFCKANFSTKEIACDLNRDKSTIYRELKRNTGQRGYRPKQAHILAINRRENSRKYIKMNSELQELIHSKIKEDLSPEQINGWLKIADNIPISHEWIYQFIWSDKDSGGELYKHLRQSNKKRRKKYGKNRLKRGQIKNRVSIDERPDIVQKRKFIGDWEADTIIGKNKKSAMVTIVERKIRLTLIAKVASRNAQVVADKIIHLLEPYKEFVKSITFDNGKEFAEHLKIAEKLNTKTYFCHPYSSWERGTNENTNGLLRQYFPKKIDLSTYSDEKINEVMNKLNNRPRKVLNFFTPNQILEREKVALIT